MDIQALFDKEILDQLRKDVGYELQMAVKTVGEQISNSSSTRKSAYEQADYIFTTGFYEKAHELNLAESDAVDVYANGVEFKENMIVREYNGYEIGIEYTRDHFSGRPVIISMWRRDVIL